MLEYGNVFPEKFEGKQIQRAGEELTIKDPMAMGDRFPVFIK